MNSLFCRHNRFTADCPICSKGSVLSREQPERAKPAPKRAATPRARRAPRGTGGAAARTFVGPHVSTGPIEHEGRIYEVRLEKVPGGIRLAEWRGGDLERKAPVLPASALRALVDEAEGRALLPTVTVPSAPAGTVPSGSGGDSPLTNAVAASPGRAGDMREELRIERIDSPGMNRVARWIYWPGDDRWDLQESPVLLPEQRFVQALSEASRIGLI